MLDSLFKLGDSKQKISRFSINLYLSTFCSLKIDFQEVTVKACSQMELCSVIRHYGTLSLMNVLVPVPGSFTSQFSALGSRAE